MRTTQLAIDIGVYPEGSSVPPTQEAALRPHVVEHGWSMWNSPPPAEWNWRPHWSTHTLRVSSTMQRPEVFTEADALKKIVNDILLYMPDGRR